jgi:membrane glycosyltransferase
MMLIQAGHVMHFVFGFDTGWDPQRRDDGSIPVKAIVRHHRSHVAMGVVTLIAGLMISPSLVAWMSPTILGLVLAIFLSWSTGLLNVGLAFRRAGLLVTPEEKTRPPLVARANDLAEKLENEAAQEAEGLAALYEDRKLATLHAAWLPDVERRRNGQMTAEKALAEAKLNEAETIEEALAWLKPKERMALLQDRALIADLLALPQQKAAVEPLSSVG